MVEPKVVGYISDDEYCEVCWGIQHIVGRAPLGVGTAALPCPECHPDEYAAMMAEVVDKRKMTCCHNDGCCEPKQSGRGQCPGCGVGILYRPKRCPSCQFQFAPPQPEAQAAFEEMETP